MAALVTALLASAVIVAGGLAAVARHLLSVALARTSRFPWAVLVVNTVGSLLAGVTLGLVFLPAEWRLVLLAGVMGGLTTFSTFSVDTVQLLLSGRIRTAVASVASNLAAGLAAVTLGYACSYLIVFSSAVVLG